MERRKFLGISAATAAAIMTGALGGIARAEFGRSEMAEGRFQNPRMFGGCRDSRLMHDSFPGFLEREIIDSRT
jgi:hypothetical protein